MNLPVDTLDALTERLNDEQAVPRSMPPSFYSNPALFEAEVSSVFMNGWVCVGRADEIPLPGDYFTIDMLNEPLVVVRNRSGNVGVMSNVCRHRGSQILSGSGSTSRLTCPYHRWSYDLEGSLLKAPLVDQALHFNPADCKLPTFRSVDWMGWIFINMSGTAEEFTDTIQGLDGYVENYHAEQMRSIKPSTERWKLNWKCLAENFMEGYHLTPVHRSTLHPMTPTRLCEKIPGGAGYTGYKSHYSESFKGRTQFHPDMSKEECAQSMMVWIYPAFVAAISPNSAVYMSITPLGPKRLQTRWDVIARDAVFESGEALERHEFAKAFNREDRERLLDVQKGLTSRFATRGFLAPPDYEGTVWDFYEYLASNLMKTHAR